LFSRLKDRPYICVYLFLSELDNTTFSTYYIYAVSNFSQVSASPALAVALDLTFALLKPIWAKFSDIFGRGEMYPIATIFLILGESLAAGSKSFSAFAVGNIFRVIGTTALNTMNTIVIADLTSTRERGFGVNFQWFPSLIIPWCASLIISAVVSPGGIGYAWGIGMLAILFPLGTSGVMFFLLKYQRRAKKLELQLTVKASMTIYELCSNIDLGGLSILIFGCAFILLPLSLASLQPEGYKTPWIIALMVIGGLLLIAMPFYENIIAAHPVLPMRYLKHRAICLAFLLYFTDYMAAAASHGFIFNWALIAKNFNIVQATNLSFINGVMTFFVGMVFGAIMYKTRSYKWWIMGGVVIRIIGYGVMFRVRSSNPNMAEIFIVQIIQGLGDGIVQTGGYVAATVNVPHRETAQIAALIVMIGTLGSSIGTAISGAIYTGSFREQLAKQLGDSATPELINSLFNSIAGVIPVWGTPQRDAINAAVNPKSEFSINCRTDILLV
jgi:MFS family permease